VSLASLETDTGAPLSDDPSGLILKGVSFRVEPGQMVALVGPTGAGKTTLCNLVPRLYDVTAGSVRVDGHDVRDLTSESLHAAIGMVTQDPHLFHDTIAMNLRYARPDATDAELVEACRAARIHDLIAGLPDGYDTIVGERGYRLSGGEKQRLALARVLLKSPAIVILDEATAHLDSETELLVQQALAEALAGRTSLVIAHRLSTVQAADQILVLDEGRIVERSTHEQLLAAGGIYQELYLTQYSRPTGPAFGPLTPPVATPAVE
jgi:ATP-binding cassette, subfamily B, bacterial